MTKASREGGGLVRVALRWIGRHELSTILSVLVTALGGFVFARVASEVSEGETQDLDRALLLLLRNTSDVSDPLGPRWLEEMGRDVTALGGTAVLSLVTIFVLGYLLLMRRGRTATLVFGAVFGGLMLSLVLKNVFERPRPDLVPHVAYVTTSSFPSGHSMLSATVYLTLGALLARMQPRFVPRAYVLLCALVVTLMVGISRVYLGVHWPTDVLAGWAAGAAWATLCWLIALWLQRRGKLDS